MSDNKTVIDRIKEYRDYKGGTKKDFEIKCGLSNGYFNSTKKTPSAEILEKVLTAFPDLSREWVMSGNGEMLINANSDLKSYQPTENVNLSSELITLYTCPECVNKQKEIDYWKSKFYALCDESREVERKYRELLEEKIEVKKETTSTNNQKAG